MYDAPVEDLLFSLQYHARLRADREGCDANALTALLTEAGRFAAARLAPLWRESDRNGARLENGVVTTTPGFADAFRDWCEAGWNGVTAPEAFGGAGLPLPVGTALMEIWTSANMAIMLCPVLGHAAIDALLAHADPALRQAWIPPLASGEMTACMALTEPQAGSDLGALRTRAEPDGSFADGSPRYRLRGSKIFISWGEHDLTANIVHLVLARLPDAPPGTKGISLFLAPKILPDGTRNDIRCTGVEHKLGIHGSPTCSMSYGDNDGAQAWLVGGPHQGLHAMFTMMNRARLATGLQGVAMAERACQQAASYAAERRQFGAPLASMPDVQRMLRAMRAETLGARAIAYEVAGAIDRAEHGGIDADHARAALLTPLAKAHAGEAGFNVATLNVQVHGGMGYVEETGAAQVLRDSRIVPIYEGTNGIQAIDLLTRKLQRDAGTAFRAEQERLADIAAACRHHADLAEVAPRLEAGLAALGRAAVWLLAPGPQDTKLAGAAPFLTLFGRVLGTALLARAAAEADQLPPGYLAALHYAATHHLAECDGLASIVTDGAASVLAD
jgi:acyl-CoA dehydrogenase